MLVSLDTLTDRESASACRGAILWAAKESFRLEQGEFFLDQILGASILTGNGDFIGVVIDVLQTPGHDVYVIEKDGKEILVPAVTEFICKVNTETNTIIVRNIENLYE